MSELRQTLEREGRVWSRSAFDEAAMKGLENLLPEDMGPGARIAGGPGAIAALSPVTAIARDLLPDARPVRVVAFDKSEAVNWALPWHQDRVIAVRERCDLPDFVNWTRKSGVWHVEPPVALLARMIFLRVHLDPADSESGCLEIAPGSHSRGRIPDDEAEGVAIASGAEQCIAERGDVLAVKALTLHRSGAALRSTHRRAIRVDYSADDLPSPLQWEFLP